MRRRIKPVGTIEIAEPQAAAATQAASAASDQPVDGKSTYTAACFACHGTGAAGAPKVGDKAAWGDRLAKGIDTLKANAINGYTGESGVMPAKGGNPALSDEAVDAAVIYMIEASKLRRVIPQRRLLSA